MITTLSGIKTIGKATVIVDIVPKGNPEIRPAYAMKPSQIAIHNTGNSGRGANAKAHNVYIHNQAKLPVSKTGYASWHFSVDDKFIYQHIPLNESAWHTGDGSGATSGNRTAIGIEICENSDMENYEQAEENAIALVAYLVKVFKISVDKVKPHQSFSGKYCPRVILKRDGSFTKFHSRIKKACASSPVTSTRPANDVKATTHKVVAGDTLWGLHVKYGVSVEALKKYNNLKNDLLTIGQVLSLVPKTVSVSTPKSNTKSNTSSNTKLPLKAVTKLGSTGQAVKDVQYLLALKGYNLTVDGIFGTGTRNAVIDFQRKHGLVADGIVGQDTWNKLV